MQKLICSLCILSCWSLQARLTKDEHDSSDMIVYKRNKSLRYIGAAVVY